MTKFATMTNSFLNTLSHSILLADGAMGTELYTRGFQVNKCYDELVLSQPDAIRSIHQAYLEAGAQLIETNTFTANRLALAAFGLEACVCEINQAAARIAREVAGGHAFVAGSVGPVSWTKKDVGVLSDQELTTLFEEQIRALVSGDVDVILLETFTHLDELKVAYETTRKITSLPVICHVSLKYLGDGEFEGLSPEKAAKALESWGADVIGVNCSDGPLGVFEAVKRMAQVTDLPLSAMPNAGLPQLAQGRLVYMATPDYLAEYARRYAQVGVKLIGGCCGTTPAHIAKMSQFLKAVQPRQALDIEVSEPPIDENHGVQVDGAPLSAAEKSSFGKHFGKKFAVSVEIEPPASTDPSKAIEGAKLLKDFGVDAVNISDGPRAMARMSATALAVLIRENVGLETITHYCCRDRNLLGMQMDFIGSAALGLNNLMLITGDPPKMGNYPEATAVFDIDSIGLIRFAANLNRGLDFAGRPIKGKTQFLIGCGVNPGAIDLDLEVERFRKKIAAGAEYVFSQPVYDIHLLEEFFRRTRDFSRIPFFVGILPLYSLRNAEFLHHEIPGMQVPKPVLEKMARASHKEAQREVGLHVAREMLTAAKGMDEVNGGVYVFPPFRSYAAVAKLLEVL